MAETTEFTIARGMTIEVDGVYDKPFYSVTKSVAPGEDPHVAVANAIDEVNAMLLIIHESDVR